MSLSLSAKAIDKLENELDAKRTKPREVFRLMARSAGGLGMRLDEPSQDDVVLPDDTTPLLAVAPGLADRLENSVLDVGQPPDEPEWVLVRRGKPE